MVSSVDGLAGAAAVGSSGTAAASRSCVGGLCLTIPQPVLLLADEVIEWNQVWLWCGMSAFGTKRTSSGGFNPL
jgi:hypothetical protein